MKYPVSEEMCKNCAACMKKVADPNIGVCYAGKKYQEKCMEIYKERRRKMSKLGWWHVNFDLTLDGQDVRWEDLDEVTKEHILECIRNDYYSGEIVIE